MCFGATCSTCSGKTWRGCGSHIPSVLGSVPEDQWCTCKPGRKVGNVEYPPMAPMEIPGASWVKSWLGGRDDSKKGEL